MKHIHETIPGWCSVEQFKLYEKMARELPEGSHIVEIGSWKGKSASFMAVEIANTGKRIRFDCIDTFKGSKEHEFDPSILNDTLLEEFTHNTKPVVEYINTIVSDSVEAASRYEDNSIDFIFVDGDHSFEGVDRDLVAWLPKLKPGGLIAGDDVTNPDYPNIISAVIKNISDVTIDKQIWTHQKQKQSHQIKIEHDEYLNLKNSYVREIDKAYIIAIKGNEKSEKQLERCIESLEFVKMPYEIFYGYDGTKDNKVKTPDHLKNKEYMKWLKVADHMLNLPEVCCALSHIALWAHCITIDKPIVILEHDALMLRKITEFRGYNVLHYLGHIIEINKLLTPLIEENLINERENVIEYYERNNIEPKPHVRYPMINVANNNYHYPLGLHAYAIDPFMAKRLFSEVMKTGIINPIDVFVDTSKFEVTQEEIYAFQNDKALDYSTLDTDPSIKFFGRKPSYDLPGVSK
jgi:GR25 family glycosyltransferase involved in LPS biosynthesis